MVESMNVGDILHPHKGYQEITIRNYASQIGKRMGRKYSVSKDPWNKLVITRNA